MMLVSVSMIASCSPVLVTSTSLRETPESQTPTLSVQDVQTGTWTPNAWGLLLEVTPLSHTTPHPDPFPSPLDGTYAKLDPTLPQWWLCRRCADYRPAGGIWKLQLDHGVMRIFYDVNGWRSVASYSIDGDRLYLFNDPYCPQEVGVYAWRMGNNSLNLEAIDDPCSFGLRAENLSAQVWDSCTPSLSQVDPAWDFPVGCQPVEIADIPPSDLSVSISVQPGNSRFYATPPDLIVPANQVEVASQNGIEISFDEDSISYGMNRVLWWDGEWIEVFSEEPFAAIGVQFMGDPPIGWARVLFDGVEVWRGNTSEIWSEFGRHGGYVEVSGFESGPHTLRVESLGFDYHPVTVAWFGFNLEGD